MAGSDNTPLISIIIPTLQEEKLIGRTLEQFSNGLRDRYSLEVIVSDGGSTDRTVPLAQGKSDLVVCNHNGCAENISIGRNRGAGAARGEILMFFNADVRIADPELFFRRMVDVIRDESVSAATCNVLIYPEEERTIDRVFHRFFNRYCRFLNDSGMGMGRGECHVIRRKVFEKAGGYNAKMAAGEDYELFVRLRHSGQVRFDSALTVFESPRRYRKLGYAAVVLLWCLNGLAALIFHRSIVKRWKPVR
jgi:glycosyltransferase involved in cell wall biosynthesis